MQLATIDLDLVPSPRILSAFYHIETGDAGHLGAPQAAPLKSHKLLIGAAILRHHIKCPKLPSLQKVGTIVIAWV